MRSAVSEVGRGGGPMKRKRIALIAAAVVAAGLIGWWIIARSNGDDGVLSASGTVEATEADLGFQVGGRIEAVRVVEGDRVESGAELARLEMAELEARRAAAAAQVGAARAQLAELERGARPEELAQAQAAEQGAREQMADAQRVLERMRPLYEGGAVSRQALDQAATAYAVARAQHEQALQQVGMVERGPRAERLSAQRAVVQQAEALLAQADAAAAYAVIHAPFDGVVSVRHRQQGEAVGAGAPVLTLMNPADRWVRIYVREDEIGRVRIGQRATIRSDSDRSRSFDGHVTYIATNAEFTPRNVQTTEERVKLVYAVKVQIAGDAEMMLKPGVPADVQLLADS
jgi:HlyD family secretion protein